MPKDVNIHVKTHGTDDARREIEQTGQTAQQMGDDVQDAGQKSQKGGEGVKQFGDKAKDTRTGTQALGRAVSYLKGALLSLVGISGLWAFFQKWLAYTREIAQAKRELADATRDVNQATKSLVSQADLMGSNKAQKAAKEQIKAIQKSGRLEDWAMAEAVAVSAHSAFGSPGQLLTEQQVDIAGIVADFAQRKSISTGAVDQLFKVLSAMDVKTEHDARLRIQQLSTVQQASKAKTFEEFITGGVKSMIPYMAQGGTPEDAMAQYAMALDVSASGDIGAEKVKQAMAMTMRPDVAAAIGGGFENLPLDQKMEKFGQWVASSSNQELLAAGLSPEQINVVRPLYSRKQLRRGARFEGIAEQATPERYAHESVAYWQTYLGRMEEVRAKKKGIEADTSTTLLPGEEIKQWAEAEFKQRQVEGKDSYWTRDEVEVEEIIKERFLRRIKRLEREGVISQKQARLLAHKVTSASSDFSPATAGHAWDRYDVDEIGEMEQMLNQLEPGGGALPPVSSFGEGGGGGFSGSSGAGGSWDEGGGVTINIGDTYNTIEGGGGRPRSYELEQ